MKIKYKEDDNKIIINDRIVPLPAPIWQVFEYQNKVIVVLPPSYGMRNVSCYNDKGEILWTLDKPEFFKVDGPPGYNGIASGHGVDEGKVLAICRGRPFYLDVDSGKVIFIPGFLEK